MIIVKKTKLQIRLVKNKRASLFRLNLISNNTHELEIRLNELDELLCKLEFMLICVVIATSFII